MPSRADARGNRAGARGGNRAKDAVSRPQGRATEAAAHRRRRNRLMGLVVALAAVAVVLAVTVALVAGTGGSGTRRPPPAASADLSAVQTFTGLSRNHVSGTVDYPQTPPVGGDHAPIWQTCGYYPSPVPNEQAVHSMEHGAVWITYAPSLPSAQVTTLRRLAQKQTYLLVSPYPGLPSPVVASAWGAQLRLPSATDPRLAAFVARYREGPQTPEPGATCSGGAGTPQS